MATRERSPNYPAHPLTESVEHVTRLYAAEKRALVPYESVAKALGYTSLSGRARVKIATLRKYGLVDEASSRVRVSDLAMRILFPRSDADKQAAIDEAGWRPELFRELRGNEGASAGTMENDLVLRGFSVEGAKAAVASFIGTMAVVSSTPDGSDKPDPEEQPMLDTPRQDKFDPRYQGAVGDSPRLAKTDLMFMWPLPDGVTALVEIKGGPLTERGVDMLTKYLELAKMAVATSPTSPTEQPQPSGQSPADPQG